MQHIANILKEIGIPEATAMNIAEHLEWTNASVRNSNADERSVVVFDIGMLTDVDTWQHVGREIHFSLEPIVGEFPERHYAESYLQPNNIALYAGKPMFIDGRDDVALVYRIYAKPQPADQTQIVQLPHSTFFFRPSEVVAWGAAGAILNVELRNGETVSLTSGRDIVKKQLKWLFKMVR